MAKIYQLDELAKLLRYSKAYVKMNLKKFPEYQVGQPIPEELAGKVADLLSREWPPPANA